jgi:ABC-type bacteriocin/lantibiotic exporter with double-glycine peptidase domain
MSFLQRRFIFNSAFKVFFPYIWRSSKTKRCFFLCIGLVLLHVGIGFGLPYMGKVLVDGLKRGQEWGALAGGVALLGILWWLDKAIHYVEDLVFFPIINAAVKDLTFRVLMHLHNVPWLDFQKLSTLKTVSSIKRISLSVRFFLRSIGVSLVPTLMRLLVALGVVFYFSTLMGFVMALGLILLMVGMYYGLQSYIQIRKKAWKATDRATLVYGDALMNPEWVRFHKDDETRQLQEVLDNEAQTWWAATQKINLLHVYMVSGMAFLFCGFMYWALIGVKQGRLSVGDLVWLKVQMAAALLPLKSLTLEIRHLLEASGDIEKGIDLLALPQEKRLSLPLKKQSPILLKIEQICFRYHPTGPWTLRNLSLEVHPGDRLLIMGPSGGGKSTLLQLMCGLMEPQQGSVYLYGDRLSGRDLSYLKAHVHYIPQNMHLFNQTLWYNLSYGLKALSHKEAWEALELVELSEKVASLDQQLLTLVGERGTYLSSGERQRLALARAYLAKPDLLLLDETSQALSVDQEKRILQRLQNHFKALVVVSHRPSLMDFGNKSYTLKNSQLEPSAQNTTEGKGFL